MQKDFEKLYHDLEAKHWWFKSRREVVVQMAKPRTEERILDIGCASGHLLADLVVQGMDKQQLFGIDVSPEAIEACHARGFEQTCIMDGANIDLPKGSFDLLIASDCLEHIRDDRQALANWFSLLKPGGRIVIFVPAFMALWSEHDEVNFHFRRYTCTALRKKVAQAGFSPVRSGYWNFLLFFPIAALRVAKRFFSPSGKKNHPTADLSMPPAPVNLVLNALLQIENLVLKFTNLPVGVSTFCMAIRK
jgi:SAM-dependent methyltransferase